MTLSGPRAFSAVQAVLIGDVHIQTEQRLEEPAFDRLRQALADPHASALDRAVLLRQALLFESERRGGEPRAEFQVKSNWDVNWASVSVRDVNSALGKRVVALPWTPSWLPFQSEG